MTERRLSDDRRRALLVDRQLVGAAGHASRGVLDVVDAVGPLHATDPSTAYLQFAARSRVSIDDVSAALYEDRSLLRHTTLRRTVHLLTGDLALAAHGAYNHRLVPRLRSQLVGWITASDEVDDDAATWLAGVEDRVVAAVAEFDRPSGNDLAAAVPELGVRFDSAPGAAHSRPSKITSRVLELVIADGRIARDRPRGASITSGAWTFAPITEWFPGGFVAPDASHALADLLSQKLTGMPGCSEADLAWWTGLPKGLIRTALAEIGAESVIRDDGATGWVMAGDSLDADDLPTDPVALLPGLDATPMGVTQRAWFLGEHGPALFDRSGNIGPTVWWRGRIVGGWTQREDGEVVTELLESIPSSVRSTLADEAERLRTWLGEVRVKWRYPTPLQRSLQES